MTVGLVMISNVVTVEMDDTLEDIRAIFQRASFHHLLVGSEGKFAGVITEKDLWKAVSPYVGTLSETERDSATLQKRAHQIMTRKHPTVTQQTSIEDAAHMLLDKGISCLPVLSPDGMIEGIVTWKDIFRALLGKVPTE
ncbi:MAG: CBS domain-containing protein [Nitrospirales bacterium]|nr:CBS domain-containing protein [Nitrospira sp.]MDR4500699.1 CBS domain-containing protein [Nitrospirales bacterium]